MNKEILQKIDNLVGIIYTPDQAGVEQSFVCFIDEMLKVMEEIIQQGKMIEVDDDLINLQNAFTKKDYVLFTDILLYDIKPKIEIMVE